MCVVSFQVILVIFCSVGTEGLSLHCDSGGANQSKWEDITASAPMNIVNRVVLFSTTVSARYVDNVVRFDPCPPKLSSVFEKYESIYRVEV